MQPLKLTLRDFDQRIPLDARRRYAWRPGTVQPFASLWITVVRFSLLNRPWFRSLNEDLQGLEAAQKNRAIKFGSRVGWPHHEFIDLDFFVRELHEPLEAFRWSSVGDFPCGIQDLFTRQLKVCPTCMSQAFHSMIFSIRGISRCPRHGDTLIDACPSCGRVLDDRIKPQSIRTVSKCLCGSRWLGVDNARRPVVDKQRDAALEEIVNWAEVAARKFWTYVPGTHRASKPWDTLQDHIARWSTQLGVPAPDCMEEQLKTVRIDGSHVARVERSGLRLRDMDRLQETGRFCFSECPQVMPGELQPEVYLLFKSIRRYVVKHVLANRVRLLVWVAENLSAPRFRNRLSLDPYLPAAWEILYWLQSSRWANPGVREWFLRLKGVPLNCVGRHDPTQHWGRSTQGLVLVDCGNEAQSWIAGWVNASSLMDLWPSQQELEAYSTDEGYMKSTFMRPGRPSVQWWAWLGLDGCLQLGVHRRQPSDLFGLTRTAKRLTKAERCFASKSHHDQRLGELRSAMSAPAFRQSHDGSWHIDGRRHFDEGVDVRSAKLLDGTQARHRFGVVLLEGAAPSGTATWLVRCLEVPVCVLSPHINEGVKKLKAAVREHQHLRTKPTVNTPAQ